MCAKIKWGIVGLGRIARTFAEDLQRVAKAELVAVASSNTERAKAFADDFQVADFYGTYEELFKNPEVAIVYVAAYHTQHAELSIAAMQHGKHVLCEKPLAINHSDAQRMIDAAKENQVFFMEGLWSRFNPSIQKILALIANGDIGAIRYVNADFAFYALDRGPKSRLLNLELGGGSLLDIGIYPIFLAYLLLGKPEDIFATSRFFHTGAEIQTSMIFSYEEAQGLLYSSVANTSEMVAIVGGDKGEIYIDSRWHETEGFTLVKNGERIPFELPTEGNGFVPEIREVHQCLTNEQLESKHWTHQNSLDLIQLLDEVRNRVGARFPMEG